MEILSAFDFLPQENFSPFLRIFVYTLVIVHLLAFVIWCVIACPGMFTKTQSFSDKVDMMLEKNK
jgi:hypothetical protein